MTRLVLGVGVNDSGYSVHKHMNGKTEVCPIYRAWTGMLERCYSESYQKRKPSYKGCSVCNEWLVFSNFKSWMEKQDWQGKCLDKDILVRSNKTYSPKTCVFVTSGVNNFVTDRGAGRGKYPLGVSWCNAMKKVKAGCSNPFTRKHEHLGYFDDHSEAHEAWRKRKHYLACKLADEQDNTLVADALRVRYVKSMEV